MNEQKIQLDDLVIDLVKQNVMRAGKSLALPKLSYQLLVFFINNPDKTNSVDEIATAVWQQREVSNETIIQRIRLLRQSLGDNSKTPRYIKSVRGFGYQLIPSPMDWVQQSAHQGNNNSNQSDLATAEVAISRSITTRNLVKFALFATGLLVLSIVSYLQLSTSSEQDKQQTSIDKNESEKNKQNRSSLIDRAGYYFQIGQQDDLLRAEKLYRKALLNPQHKTRASIGLANTLSALVCRFAHPTELALESEALIEHLLTNPTLSNATRADAWSARGYSVDCQGNLKLALQNYMKAAELDPGDIASISSAAHLMEKNGDLISAIQWNLKALSLGGKNSLTQLQLARNLELLGFTKRAEQIYSYLYEHYPDSVFINEAYPQFQFSQGRLEEARSLIKQSMERSIHRKDLYRLLGEIEWRQNNIDSAKHWFNVSQQSNQNVSFNKTLVAVTNNRMSKQQASESIEQINQAINQGDTWQEGFFELYLIEKHIMHDQSTAFQALERLVDSGFLDQNYLRQSAFFTDVLETEEFTEILNKLSLKRNNLNDQLVERAILPASLLNETIPWDGQLE